MNLQEGCWATISCHEINHCVSDSCGQSFCSTGSKCVFSGNVTVNRTIICNNFDEGEFGCNCWERESLPVVTICERITVFQKTIGSVWASGEHLTLQRSSARGSEIRSKRFTQLTVGSWLCTRTSGERVSRGIEIQKPLCEVLNFYSKYRHFCSKCVLSFVPSVYLSMLSFLL